MEELTGDGPRADVGERTDPAEGPDAEISPGTTTGEVNLYIHQHYLLEFVRPGMSVLDLGPRCGSLTLFLLGLGCRVTSAVVTGAPCGLHRRMTPGSFFSQRSGSTHSVRAVLGLEALEENSWDAVVCLAGAFTFFFRDPLSALGEFVRVCRPGGHVMVSGLSLWGALSGYLSLSRESRAGGANEGTARAPREDRPSSWGDVHRRLEPLRGAELRDMGEKAGLQALVVSASNALSVGWGSFLPGLAEDPLRREALLRMEVDACRAEESLDMGTHVILLGRTPSPGACPTSGPQRPAPPP